VCVALVFSILSDELASPVSRCAALNATLASLVQKSMKHCGPPRGPEYRIGGITVQTENFPPHPYVLFFANVVIVLPCIEQAYAKTQ
jgi:hypothetical protein